MSTIIEIPTPASSQNSVLSPYELHIRLPEDDEDRSSIVSTSSGRPVKLVALPSEYAWIDLEEGEAKSVRLSATQAGLAL